MNQSRIKGEGWSIQAPHPPVILLLDVQRWLICFGSLVVLDAVCGNVLFFLLDKQIENR